MNLAPKKTKILYLPRHEGKGVKSCKGALLLIWEDLTLPLLLTGPVFSLRELSTDLKNRFSLLKLSKTMRFCSKTLHKHYIYENCKIYFFEIHNF